MFVFTDRKSYTTGVLVRNKDIQNISLNFLSLGKKSEIVQYRVYDRDGGMPVLLKLEEFHLLPNESKSRELKLFDSYYDQKLDIKLFEVRFNVVRNNSITVNMVCLSDDGTIDRSNSILFSQLVPISNRLCALDF